MVRWRRRVRRTVRRRVEREACGTRTALSCVASVCEQKRVELTFVPLYATPQSLWLYRKCAAKTSGTVCATQLARYTTLTNDKRTTVAGRNRRGGKELAVGRSPARRGEWAVHLTVASICLRCARHARDRSEASPNGCRTSGRGKVPDAVTRSAQACRRTSECRLPSVTARRMPAVSVY